MASLRDLAIIGMVSIGAAMILAGWYMDGVYSRNEVGFQSGGPDYSAQILQTANVSGTVVSTPTNMSGFAMLVGAIFLSMTPIVAAIFSEMEKYRWQHIEYTD